MKKITFFLITISIFGCTQKATNNSNEILHYSITNDNVKLQEKNKEFVQLYNSLEPSNKTINNFEEALLNFGYIKNKISKEKISKINHTLVNDINLKYHEVACIPMYKDILILKKGDNIKTIIKICFECGMNEVSGNIKSNFDYENSKKMSNYNILHLLLYNKNIN